MMQVCISLEAAIRRAHALQVQGRSSILSCVRGQWVLVDTADYEAMGDKPEILEIFKPFSEPPFSGDA